MSERVDVEVRFPLARVPNRDETRSLIRQGYGKAKELLGPGRVLGFMSMAVATDGNSGQPVLLCRYACEAPESVQVATQN